jgi:arylformamidase
MPTPYESATAPRGPGSAVAINRALCAARHSIPEFPLSTIPAMASPPLSDRLIDVSHCIEHGMATYKGLPAPLICDYLSREASRDRYAPGTEFQIGKIEMVANTGTYVDSPFHRYADGKDLADLPLSSLANLDCIVVRCLPGDGPCMDRVPLRADEVRGRAILFDTGWDRHWRTDAYFEGHPYLSGEAAEWLARHGAALVGIDSHNIDDTGTNTRPVHSVLLGHEIPIVEHLRGLRDVPERGGRFFGVPVKVRGFGTFPVRAFVLA